MKDIKPLKINPKYRNTYHFSAPFGWINDPNGLCEFNGKTHVFYQYNPFSEVWGPMHWGHATTTDFVKFEHHPIALEPSIKNIDDVLGIFSGSILVEDGKMNVFYTGVGLNNTQQTCFAESKDGFNFIKYQEPIIPISNTPNTLIDGFRDPFIFKNNNFYYLLMGACTKENGGEVLLYKSADKYSWQLIGSLLKSMDKAKEPATIECPSYQILDGKEILIASFNPSSLTQYGVQNINSVQYAVGHLDLDSGIFKTNALSVLDYGFDFYAPQSFKLHDGRTIIIAWLFGFNKLNPLADKKHGWCGTHSLARELYFVGNTLHQRPVREIENYYRDEIEIKKIDLCNEEKSIEDLFGDHIQISFDLNLEKSQQIGVNFYKSGKEYTSLYLDSEEKCLVLDISSSGIKCGGIEPNTEQRKILLDITKPISINMLLDTSCFEIFVNNGEKTLSSLIYRTKNGNKLTFFAKNGKGSIKNIIKHNIVVS